MSLIRRIVRKLRQGPLVPLELPFACPVCGGSRFHLVKILWPELIEQWGLSQEEVAYTDRQQGAKCRGCNSNLRSMTLADALRTRWKSARTLQELCQSDEGVRALQLLELNPAGDLSPVLEQLPHHTLGSYPEVDMQAMPYPDESFDIIVHSDTLEHVPDPAKALSECLRVLKTGGAMIYTVPVIFDRPSRRRDGLPDSFHGMASTQLNDWKVISEYGSDFYLEPARRFSPNLAALAALPRFNGPDLRQNISSRFCAQDRANAGARVTLDELRRARAEQNSELKESELRPF